MPSVSGDTDADREAIAHLLDEHPEITAFVAAEYQFAVLVHEVLASLGLLERSAPIACFDMPDLPFAAHDFFHVRQDERAMGRLAVNDLLVAQVNGDDVPPVSLIPYVIVDRRPTGDAGPDARRDERRRSSRRPCRRRRSACRRSTRSPWGRRRSPRCRRARSGVSGTRSGSGVRAMTCDGSASLRIIAPAE